MPEWVPAIELHKQVLTFKKGEVIFKEGEKVKGIYFLNSGNAKVHKYWAQGKEMILRFAKQGDILGHRGFGNTDVYPVSATALQNVSACFIETDFFLKTLKVNPDLTLMLMMFYSGELQEAERRMRDLAHMDVKGRIADTFLMLQNRFGTDEAGCINIELTRQDIASFAGTIYETFFKVVSEMARGKIIKITGKKIKLLKLSKLETFARANTN